MNSAARWARQPSSTAMLVSSSAMAEGCSSAGSPHPPKRDRAGETIATVSETRSGAHQLLRDTGLGARQSKCIAATRSANTPMAVTMAIVPEYQSLFQVTAVAVAPTAAGMA